LDSNSQQKDIAAPALLYHESVRDSVNTSSEEQSPIKLRIQAARRARAAIGLSAIMLLTITIGCIYRLCFRANPLGIQAILLMGLVGLVLLSLGRSHASRRMTELVILRFYKSFRFYGTVVSITAALLFIYALMLKPAAPVQARVVPTKRPIAVEPTPKPQPVMPIAPPTTPEFPELRLTGVILHGSRSSAVINQKTLKVGDYIDGVRLVEVQENRVVVEKSGLKKTISRFVMPATAMTKIAAK
jgi:hypothetical protein